MMLWVIQVIQFFMLLQSFRVYDTQTLKRHYFCVKFLDGSSGFVLRFGRHESNIMMTSILCDPQMKLIFKKLVYSSDYL